MCPPKSGEYAIVLHPYTRRPFRILSRPAGVRTVRLKRAHVVVSGSAAASTVARFRKNLCVRRLTCIPLLYFGSREFPNTRKTFYCVDNFPPRLCGERIVRFFVFFRLFSRVQSFKIFARHTTRGFIFKPRFSFVTLGRPLYVFCSNLNSKNIQRRISFANILAFGISAVVTYPPFKLDFNSF